MFASWWRLFGAVLCLLGARCRQREARAEAAGLVALILHTRSVGQGYGEIGVLCAGKQLLVLPWRQGSAHSHVPSVLLEIRSNTLITALL